MSTFWILAAGHLHDGGAVAKGTEVHGEGAACLKRVQETELAADDGGGLLKCAESDGVVGRIEEAVESGATRAHAVGHFGFGKMFVRHGRFNLPGEHALDGGGGDLLVDAFFTKPGIER